MGALPERFETGDVLVIPHGDAYYLADPPKAQRTYGHDDAVSFFATWLLANCHQR